jgi:chromosome segregation ATPase
MGRTQTTIRLRDELVDTLDEEADERGISRSEYVREILHERHRADELEKEMDTLRDRLEGREERVRALEEQLARRSEMEKKIEELPERVRDDPTPPWPIRWYEWFRRG